MKPIPRQLSTTSHEKTYTKKNEGIFPGVIRPIEDRWKEKHQNGIKPPVPLREGYPKRHIEKIATQKGKNRIYEIATIYRGAYYGIYHSGEETDEFGTPLQGRNYLIKFQLPDILGD